MQELPIPDPPLADGEIRLRYRTQADLPALVRELQDPEIPRWTRVPSPYSMRDARDFLARSETERRAGLHLNLLVFDDADALLGAVGLMREPGRPDVGELGYWIARGARGRGICPRAVTLLRDWAADELGLRKLEILIDERNAPSQRVALKAGFTDTGELRPAPRTDPPAPDPTHHVYRWEPTSEA